MFVDAVGDLAFEVADGFFVMVSGKHGAIQSLKGNRTLMPMRVNATCMARIICLIPSLSARWSLRVPYAVNSSRTSCVKTSVTSTSVQPTSRPSTIACRSLSFSRTWFVQLFRGGQKEVLCVYG